MTLSLPVVRTEHVQIAHYDAGSKFGPYRLLDYELVWILVGSARQRIAQDDRHALAPTAEYRLEPGRLALARKGHDDEYIWDTRVPTAHAYVHFDFESTGLLPLDVDWPAVRSVDELPALAGLCSYLLDLANDDSDAARARTAQVVAIIVDLFVRGPFPAKNPAVLAPAFVDAMAFVRYRWHRDGVRIVSLAELAEAGRVSAGHFSRLFQAEFRCGPARALELIRLARAAAMLQRSNLALDEIARQLGFSSAYHFSRRFSAVYGTPPGRFRSSRQRTDPIAPLTKSGLMPLWAALHIPADEVWLSESDA
jgi:AraC family transcriptional regulator